MTLLISRIDLLINYFNDNVYYVLGSDKEQVKKT